MNTTDLLFAYLFYDAITEKKRKATWIPNRQQNGAYIYECSKCKNIESYKHPFCKNCGAEMKGE